MKTSAVPLINGPTGNGLINGQRKLCPALLNRYLMMTHLGQRWSLLTLGQCSGSPRDRFVGNILWRRYLAFLRSLAIWLLAEGHTLCHSTLLKVQLDTLSEIRVAQDRTEPCIGLSPVSDWALCWTEPCIGLIPVLDWALYWTDLCIELVTLDKGQNFSSSMESDFGTNCV
jgi:hypothetical protein